LPLEVRGRKRGFTNTISFGRMPWVRSTCWLSSGDRSTWRGPRRSAVGVAVLFAVGWGERPPRVPMVASVVGPRGAGVSVRF